MLMLSAVAFSQGELGITCTCAPVVVVVVVSQPLWKKDRRNFA